MIFQSKIDRAMQWLTDKNKSAEVHDHDETSDAPFDPRAEWLAEQESEMKLEKGDISAIIISALLVFGPVLLVLVAIGFIAYYLVYVN